MASILLLALVCCTVARADDAPKASRAKEPELRLELLRRVKADQEARSTLVAWLKKNGGGVVDPAALPANRKAEYEKRGAAVKKVDQENTERLGVIIEEHGWPAISLVDKDGSHAAWLLVQHADADPKFQRKCLDLMAKLPKTEASQADLAYLTDRVLLAESKKANLRNAVHFLWREVGAASAGRRCERGQAAGRSRLATARRVCEGFGVAVCQPFQEVNVRPM